MILSLEKVKTQAYKFRGITGQISNIFPQLNINLKKTDVIVDGADYIAAVIVNSLLWGLLFFIFIFVLLSAAGEEYNKTLLISLGLFAFTFFLFFIVLLVYPGIIAGKRAEEIDKDLVYALKDMLLEVSAGSSLYEAILTVAKSEYGIISEEFLYIIKKVDTGVPIDDAMEDLALGTSSEFLRNATWQMINALKAGSNIEGTLKEIVKTLIANQRNMIRNYAQELNVLSLIYMLFAVVIPTIATTIVIIVGPFMGLNTGPEIFLYILPVTFFTQIAILELIKSRRPAVHL